MRRRTNRLQRVNVLGELTGGIVHDFRNVLAVINSALRLAQRHELDPDKRRECLAAALSGVDRGMEIATRLLALARPPVPDLHGDDPSRLIRDLLPFLKYGAGPQIELMLELETAAVDCIVDPPFFNEAMLNLVVNARDAMPNGGRISIGTDIVSTHDVPSDDPQIWLRVSVSDTGQGMKPEVADRIFDPWFTTKGEMGTGLGLPQVHRYATSVGGHISISTALGSGTRFDLFFPVRSLQSGLPAGIDGSAVNFGKAIMDGDRLRASR